MIGTAGDGRQQTASTLNPEAIVDYATGHACAGCWRCCSSSSLLAFLPGFFSIPPVDRDEARFAQATKQMVESGDYIDIRFQDKVRYKKPVGIYWLQAGVVQRRRGAGRARSAHHASGSIAFLRLIGAIGAVLLTYWTALAFVLAARRGAGGADDGEFDPARRRGAAGQDRRHAAAHHRGGDGRLGARLFAGAGRVRARCCRHGGSSPRCSGPRWRAASCSRGR